MSAARKYVPAEAYRFLVLAALAHRGDAGASKGQLAWETRANHYMITRVLRELSAAGSVSVAAAGDGYRIALTPAGREFLERNRAYFVATFRAVLLDHFRYGTAPSWAGFAREA